MAQGPQSEKELMLHNADQAEDQEPAFATRELLHTLRLAGLDMRHDICRVTHAVPVASSSVMPSCTS